MATGWWSLLALRGLLPAGFSIASGVLVGAIQHQRDLGLALVVVGVLFILLQGRSGRGVPRPKKPQ